MNFSLSTDPLDFILRADTLLIFLVAMVYWRISEVMAEKEKPKEKRSLNLMNKVIFTWFSYRVVSNFVLLQVIGLHIASMPGNIVLQGCRVLYLTCRDCNCCQCAKGIRGQLDSREGVSD